MMLFSGFLWVSSASAAQPPPSQELVFLNWSEYMEPELIKEFSEQYQIPVKEVFFESDLARTDMLLRTQGQGYDVVLTVGMDVSVYRKRGWLAPITTTQVPHLKYAAPRWLDAFEQSAKGYGVPYLWGGLGILYRKDKINTPIDSWKALFEPSAALKHHIHMQRDPRDIVGLALKSLGYSYNSKSRKELKQAEQLLLAQKPWVASYGVPILNETSGFVTGDYWLGMAFNGDALALKELNEQLEFVIPKEGTGLWCDYLTVMQASKNKEAAFKFINFLNQPEHAMRLAQYVQYASPNQAAEALLPSEYLKNPLIYPTQQVLERSETGQPSLPPRMKKMRTAIYNKLIR